VQFLGRFEHLLDDFDFVQRRLGTRGPLLHLNKSECSWSCATQCATLTSLELRSLGALPDYSAFYTDELIEVVGKLYADDVRRFRYDPPVLIGSGLGSLRPALLASTVVCPAQPQGGDAA
jgi:hypothetical protein